MSSLIPVTVNNDSKQTKKYKIALDTTGKQLLAIIHADFNLNKDSKISYCPYDETEKTYIDDEEVLAANTNIYVY
jgi:hypothetical protein